MVLVGGKGSNGQRWAPKRPQHLPLWGWGGVGTGVREAEWKELVLKTPAGFLHLDVFPIGCVKDSLVLLAVTAGL